MHTWRNAGLFGALLSLATACTGTSTGNPIGDGSREPGENGGQGTAGKPCREVRRQQLANDAVSPLGFSAAQVLANAREPHTVPLQWQALTVAEYAPESGTQALTVSIAATGALAAYVDYEPDSAAFAGEIAAVGVQCPDQLEIEVDVHVASTQGALNEHFRTQLVAQRSERAWLTQRLAPTRLEGSFAITSVLASGYRMRDLRLGLTLTRFGVSGSLDGTFEQQLAGSDSVSSDSDGSIASFGAARCDGVEVAVPASAKVAGFSGDEVIERIASSKLARATWSGREGTSELTLAFEPEQDGACALIEESVVLPAARAGTLFLRGVLVVKSSDGRIDARWPVVAVARPDASGTLEVIALELDPRAQIPEGPLSQRYGIHGFDESRYDFFGAHIALGLAPSGAWSGTVVVTGYVRPSCSTTPVVEAGGGARTDGCMGATPHELATATLASD